MSTGSLDQRRADRLQEERDRAHRVLRWCILAGAAAAVGAAILIGSLPVQVAVVVVALATLQGLWAGGVQLLGTVAGLALAVPLAMPVGRALEGVTASIVGTTGLTNRLISIALVALLVSAAGAILGRLAGRRLLRSRPGLKGWNPYVGTILGGAEGCLLALIILWTPLALEPIARAQMTDPDVGGEPRAPSFIAVAVAHAADLVRSSALGGLAQSTSPFASSDLLALAADFAAISRDPDALRFFMEQPVMRRIQDMGSVRAARAILETDPEFAGMFDGGGISAENIHRMMDSPTVLRVFDETTVARDLRPLEPDLIQAIKEARTRVRTGSHGR